MALTRASGTLFACDTSAAAAPGALTKPNDRLLRRLFRGRSSTADCQFRAGLLGLWLCLDVRGFRPVLARDWHRSHGVTRRPGPMGSTQGTDRVPRARSSRKPPLTPTGSVNTSGAPATPVVGTDRSVAQLRSRRQRISPMTSCLQNTLGLSATVAHLAPSRGVGRWDRLVSGPVVVSGGGQSWTRARYTCAREGSVVADGNHSPGGALAGLHLCRSRCDLHSAGMYGPGQPGAVDLRGDLPGRWCSSTDFCGCYSEAAKIKLGSGRASVGAALNSTDLLIRRDLRSRRLPGHCPIDLRKRYSSPRIGRQP